MSRPGVERVDRLLIDHEYSLTMNTRSICRCGYKPPRDPERGWSQQEWHREHIARTVLALFEPETVTTAAEIEALPVGSVVLDPRGHALEKRHVPPDGFGITVGWYPTGSPGYLRRAPLPATVLHRGGAA